MSKLMEKYRSAKGARQKAKQWQNLPNGKKYNGSSFKISLAHSKPPMLTRAGQQTCGGQNYWETEKEFNDAILAVIVENWDDLWPMVEAKLLSNEKDALLDCQGYIDEFQKLINDAKIEKP